MSIQKCTNCGTSFKYKDLLKSLWPDTGYIKCKNCGASHQITRLSSFIFSALIILSGFLISSLTLNILLRLSVLAVWVVILGALSPYIIRYKLKENDDTKE
jgi:CXXC-20-CXXC protein